MVVKAEEHGFVRCKVFNGNNGNFPFVLCRHPIQGSFFYQRRYFGFFPKLFLYCSCLFFQEGLGDAEDKVTLGYVSRLFGLLFYVLGYILLRLGPWALKQTGPGSQFLWSHNSPSKSYCPTSWSGRRVLVISGLYHGLPSFVSH